MEGLLSSGSMAVPDLRIDDRDVPLYPNFYSFCTDENGLNIMPYPRQLSLAVQLLGEYCPKCSAKAAGNVERVPKNASRKAIEKNIVFLEFGKCPQCGSRKHRMVDKGKLNLYDEMDLVLGQRSGKALDIRTPIYTTNGWKCMENMEVGDTVFDMTGKPTKVVAASEIMEDRKCIDMEFSDGEHVICDSEHLWITDCMFKKGDRTYKRGVRTAQEIQETLTVHNGNGTYVSRHSVPLVPALERDPIDLPVDPYVLGVWLGDGRSSGASITLHDDDVEILDSIERAGYEVGRRRGKDENTGAYTIHSGLQTALRKMKVLNNKHIPEAYTQGSTEQRLALLQGLMDTDGHAHQNGRPEFTTTNAKMAEVFVDVCVSLGMKAVMPNELPALLNGRQCGTKFRVLLETREFEVFRLERKVERQRRLIQEKNKSTRRLLSESRRIVSAETTKSVPVRCIQTEAGTYLCGLGMIPTHNSALLGNMIAPYLLHRWLKTTRPQETLGLLRSMPLVGTLCAQTFAKAQELLFQPFRDVITTSHWFIEYHKVLDHYQEKHGYPLFKLGANALRYDHKGLFFHPSGPNKRTLRGPTRVLSMLDEIGWFAQGEDKEHLEKASANEVYKSLGNSLLTVQSKARRLIASGIDNFPMAVACNISSPSSHFDKAMSLVRTYKDSDRVLVAQMATWEFNPDFSKSDFAKEYQDDPIKAERDFGANPPIAASPWMTDMDNVRRSLRKARQKFQYEYRHKKNSSGQRQRYAGITRMKRRKMETRAVLGLDAGHSFNSFGLSLTTPVVSYKEDYEMGLELPFTVDGAEAHLIAEVAPEKASSTVVNHTLLAKNFIYPVIEEFDVGLVVADRWQSIKMLTDIEEEFGIPTLQYTMKGDDFNLILNFFKDEECHGVSLPGMEMDYDDLFKMDMFDYPDCFKYKPMSHLAYQFMVSNVDAKGVAQKGVDATDDLLRALCIGLSMTLNGENIEAYDLLEEPDVDPIKMALGVRSDASTAMASQEIRGNAGVRVLANGGAERSGSSSNLGARGSVA